MKKYFIFLFCTLLYSHTLVSPLDTDIKYDKQKAQLGKKLFFDTKLSKDNTISCFSCHNVYTNGAETSDVSTGIDGQKGVRNSPTIFNSSLNFVQFWDGRSKTLQSQAIHPIIDPIEMGNTKDNLLNTLKKDKEYQKKFKAIYKDGITIANITNAIAEYEKALITPNSRFDKYLNGDTNAITKEELEGFEIFNKKGCISCHNGINFGGNMYQKFGVVMFVDDSTDLGRYKHTKKERDKFLFKVPSLRNISKTAPYFHDARTDSLEIAVRIMVKRQIGRSITDDEVDKIIKFLHTLEGELPDIVKEDLK
jgi:cytochrome c peroxidase